MINWIKFKDEYPPENVGILISDGVKITVAELETFDKDQTWFNAHGWWGYEYEFDDEFKDKDKLYWSFLPYAPNQLKQ